MAQNVHKCIRPHFCNFLSQIPLYLCQKVFTFCPKHEESHLCPQQKCKGRPQAICAKKHKLQKVGNLFYKTWHSWQSIMKDSFFLLKNVTWGFTSLETSWVTENFNSIFAWQLDFISGAVDPGEHGRCRSCRGRNLLRKVWGSGNREEILGLR